MSETATAILQRLNDLGFAVAEVTGDRKGLFCLRIRTAKGWVYDRFSEAGAVDAWARRHSPEISE